MILHVFNPEHDIALASNLSNFTAPHAGRQLRYDLGFLPALWAEDGDIIKIDLSKGILVNLFSLSSVNWAKQRVSPMETTCFYKGNNLFLQRKQLVSIKETKCFLYANRLKHAMN